MIQCPQAAIYNPPRFWNRRAKTDPDMLPVGELHEKMAELIGKHVFDTDSFLEVGVGTGRIFQYLAERGMVHTANYAGCDISDEYISIAQCTGIACYWWNGNELPFPDASYDWLISFSVMLHVPPANIARFVAEHARVMRRHLFVSTYWDVEQPALAPHCFHHDYADLFEAAGLATVEYWRFEELKQSQWLLEKPERSS